MKHNFERFELKPFLIEALASKNITLPTEIQERLIPAIKNGMDVIGQSQTGTGKTYAFLLPILHRIDITKKETQAVITAPTRELAGQLYEELKKLTDFSDETIDSQLVVGGTDRLRMMNKLKHSPHVVVGTPGRIADMVDKQALDVHHVEMFVVDEADQMLDMGFIEDVDRTASRMGQELQMMVFSATIPEKLKPFLKKYLKNPRQVEVQPKTASPKKIQHWLVPDRDRERKELLINVVNALNPFLAVIFTNKKETADEVYAALQDTGIDADILHGGVSPRQRKKVMKRLQDAEVQFLVATDLVARGIDVVGISHIINYELPTELEYYIHRVGRTARAGWDGIAITFYGRNDQDSIQKLEKQGISFVYRELKNGEWKDIEKRNRPRMVSTRTEKAVSAPKTGGSVGKAKAKPKKVKPGYKKKARYKKAKEEQRQRRIENKKRK
ncbi:ATP-dependent RNA helicase CshB [Evansella vedderi]|uniref:ATP-dependent RNA helicase CshB n=1 Tax=Evansella vedderi TaxID=38282 RepID=A0ABT9ZU33_9BACI|nr:DEAD/DEAH box helicase [Evansella vedderi]MDQ0254379.1 ATP-dependent RNA helicase CshB [Evansella vedderi]